MYVYVMYNDKNEVLYVGKTINIESRMRQHFGKDAEEWKMEVKNIKYMNCFTEIDMSIYEIYLINVLKPKYNASMLYKGESFLNLEYKLIDYTGKIEDDLYEDITQKDKDRIKKFLIIYEDKGKSKFNSNYDSHKNLKRYSNVLSNRWCLANRDKYDKVIKNALSYFRRVTSSTDTKMKNSYFGMWENCIDLNNIHTNNIKNHINKINKTHEIKAICYLRNDYISREDKSIDDKLSIMRLVKIILDTDIKNDEFVHAYITSSRMRNLLNKYINNEL